MFGPAPAKDTSTCSDSRIRSFIFKVARLIRLTRNTHLGFYIQNFTGNFYRRTFCSNLTLRYKNKDSGESLRAPNSRPFRRKITERSQTLGKTVYGRYVNIFISHARITSKTKYKLNLWVHKIIGVPLTNIKPYKRVKSGGLTRPAHYVFRFGERIFRQQTLW